MRVMACLQPHHFQSEYHLPWVSDRFLFIKEAKTRAGNEIQNKVGSTECEKTPAVLAVAGTRAPSARPADRPHMAASLRSRPLGDQGGSYLSNLPLPGYFRRGGQKEPFPAKRNSLRRSLFRSARQLPNRTLRPPGRDLFRRRRG